MMLTVSRYDAHRLQVPCSPSPGTMLTVSRYHAHRLQVRCSPLKVRRSPYPGTVQRSPSPGTTHSVSSMTLASIDYTGMQPQPCQDTSEAHRRPGQGTPPGNRKARIRSTPGNRTSGLMYSWDPHSQVKVLLGTPKTGQGTHENHSDRSMYSWDPHSQVKVPMGTAQPSKDNPKNTQSGKGTPGTHTAR
jgi:hypothetical protein